MRNKGLKKMAKREREIRIRKITRFLCGFWFDFELKFVLFLLTCDAAEEPQCGRVTAVLVDHSSGGCLWYGDRQSDGPVELPPAGFHRYDGRDGHPVTQQFHHQFRLNRLSLLFFFTQMSVPGWKKKNKKFVLHTRPFHGQSSLWSFCFRFFLFLSFVSLKIHCVWLR